MALKAFHAQIARSQVQDVERIARSQRHAEKAAKDKARVEERFKAQKEKMEQARKEEARATAKRMQLDKAKREERWTKKYESHAFHTDLWAEDEAVYTQGKIVAEKTLTRERALETAKLKDAAFRRTEKIGDIDHLEVLRKEKKRLQEDQKQLKALLDVDKVDKRCAAAQYKMQMNKEALEMKIAEMGHLDRSHSDFFTDKRLHHEERRALREKAQQEKLHRLRQSRSTGHLSLTGQQTLDPFETDSGTTFIPYAAQRTEQSMEQTFLEDAVASFSSMAVAPEASSGEVDADFEEKQRSAAVRIQAAARGKQGRARAEAIAQKKARDMSAEEKTLLLHAFIDDLRLVYPRIEDGFRAMDNNGNGTLSLSEWKQGIAGFFKGDASLLFRMIDKDKSGTVSIAELRRKIQEILDPESLKPKPATPEAPPKEERPATPAVEEERPATPAVEALEEERPATPAEVVMAEEERPATPAPEVRPQTPQEAAPPAAEEPAVVKEAPAVDLPEDEARKAYMTLVPTTQRQFVCNYKTDDTVPWKEKSWAQRLYVARSLESQIKELQAAEDAAQEAWLELVPDINRLGPHLVPDRLQDKKIERRWKKMTWVEKLEITLPLFIERTQKKEWER